MTTEPERSFGRYFSRAGRLENAWASALAHTDPARALERLRALYRRFDGRSADAAQLWLPFQESVLDARFAGLVTDDDVEQLAAVGQQLAIAAGGGLSGRSSMVFRLNTGHVGCGIRRVHVPCR